MNASEFKLEETVRRSIYSELCGGGKTMRHLVVVAANRNESVAKRVIARMMKEGTIVRTENAKRKWGASYLLAYHVGTCVDPRSVNAIFPSWRSL